MVFIGSIGIGLPAAIILAATETKELSETQPTPYRLAEVSRGPAVTKVLAAGTIQPVVSVVVGSQVSGQVQEILVDYNDSVKEGQPIARLDPQLFVTRVEQARAEVDVARQAVRIAMDEVATAEAAGNSAAAERNKAEAEVKRAEVVADNALRRFERKTQLVKSGSSSVSDLDDARTAHEAAAADVESIKAQLASQQARAQEAGAKLGVARSRVAHSEAQVRRSEAALRQAEADLERTVIRAPMDGVVIERSVTAGQTVAASFQAPTLFTIGDLSAVSIELAIDEADIGQIALGQSVTFSVDAYPNKAFDGRVVQIRKAPHTQDSVVTYTVVASATNEGQLLFPGMTAKAEIITDVRPDALQVPSAALRYRPQGIVEPSGSHVWVFDRDSIHPIAVRVGLSSGGLTEIVGPLRKGTTIIVGNLVQEAHRDTVTQTLRLMLASWTGWVRAAVAERARS
ncbi:MULTISPECIES: efflux RND transporter periplasmic adaptor subunit [unclassified Bradyrhizobium]|uniref:efflux RND transporter periplasmic adaptor subunit n=1 Tax=unclassified Bradyrhizobium TaxID=2631580 RepID=UPI0024796E23|nr:MULTISPECIES: efflux RND transporter periplasmic adaptor subunit [unclassified Bradyrhizobium]WGS18294.1 efflux RND transporter periplasmic adaptor subunit [Bradyrhizobium sp. ISRA463]WGS25109.1 efflux RND transporter periplasmic adaptor subunit [Bradyrhizobium sp. ISRA464]